MELVRKRKEKEKSVAEYDLVIKGGTIVDGLQRPRYRADLAVRDGRIARIGAVRTSDADRVLDASGLIVAPGFVDCHTHYDSQIQWDPWCTISSWHGVTTVALGNCGFGFAPVAPENRERAMQTMERNEAIALDAMKEGMLWDWVTFPEWMDTLDRIPKGVNCVSYVPLAPVMIWAMGLEAAKSRGATPDEVATMQRLIHEGMDAGAIGWSVQRLGENSTQPDFDGTPMVTDTMTDEDCLAMADVLAQRGGEGVIQITQNNPNERGESSHFEFQRLLAIRAAGAAVFHNVIPCFPGKAAQIQRERMAWIDRCRAEGLNVYGQAVTGFGPSVFRMDTYNQADLSPAWKEATLGTREEKIAKFRDPARRQALKDQLWMWEGLFEDASGNTLGGRVSDIVVRSTGGNSSLTPYLGRTLGEVARERGQELVDAFLDIAADSNLDAEFESATTSGAQDPDLLAEVVNHPAVVPGLSDGGAHTKFFTMATYSTQTLAYLVRDHQTVTLEHAHYKLSCLPAHFAGIKDRGFLLEGAPADIVVYDLEGLRPIPQYGYEVLHDQPANEWRRVVRAEGYRWTLVNGEVTFEDGTCTTSTPGRLLRHGKDA
jgi:N-acyl-D-aspartate/D-glutamate deacylase